MFEAMLEDITKQLIHETLEHQHNHDHEDIDLNQGHDYSGEHDEHIEVKAIKDITSEVKPKENKRFEEEEKVVKEDTVEPIKSEEEQ